jgi:chromate transporter
MTYLLLILEFFKTGLFSIGGGMATLPFLYEIADRYPWYTSHMLMDMIAVSESTPGAIGINMATYAGNMAAGLPGGITATLSLVAPSIVIIVIIAKFLEKFQESKIVKYLFYGLKPATCGLISAACYQILKISVLKESFDGTAATFLASLDVKAIIVLVVMCIVVWKWKKHPIVYIAGGAVIGLLFRM